MASTDGDIRAKLAHTVNHARRDAALFAAVTIILTPVFVAAAVVVLCFAFYFADLPVIDYLGYGLSFVTGANLSLIFIVGSYFLRPKAAYQQGKGDRIWVGIGLLVLCGLLGFSYATPLAKTHPEYFWPIYFLLAFAMLGCMGHAYEPGRTYYLGWNLGLPGLFDNPFTIEDDIDRAHVSLGIVVALPHLIMRSYSEIFGSTWIWRGLVGRELSAAAELLQALSSDDEGRANAALQALGVSSALRVVRVLAKVELITIERDRVRLSWAGQTLLGVGRWQ